MDEKFYGSSSWPKNDNKYSRVIIQTKEIKMNANFNLDRFFTCAREQLCTCFSRDENR